MIRCPYCDCKDLEELTVSTLDSANDSFRCYGCQRAFLRMDCIRILTCEFCKTSEEYEDAMELEWVPSFRNETGESSSACLSCAMRHLRYNPVDGQHYPIARFPSYSF